MKAFGRLLSTAALCSLLAACQERLPEPITLDDQDSAPLELEVITNPAGVTRGPIYDTVLPEGARIGVAIVEKGLDTYNGKSIMNIPYEAKTKDGSQVWLLLQPSMKPLVHGTSIEFKISVAQLW